jgi:hypothetical protein
MIEFTIEIYHGKDTAFRLQADKRTWKKIETDAILENDFVTSDIYELVRLQNLEATVLVDGDILTVRDEGVLSDEDDTIHYAVQAHRDYFPLIPSREQLVSTIRHGDDNVSNALILNIFGYFELRNRETVNASIEDPTIVVRSETFGAGNGYVGEEAAVDDKHIDMYYAEYLRVWAHHLENGMTNIFTSFEVDQPTHATLDLIKQLEISNQEKQTI